MNFLMIGLGGSIGAISRYSLNELLIKIMPTLAPLGTLCINILGCLLIGMYLGNSMPIKDSSYYFFCNWISWIFYNHVCIYASYNPTNQYKYINSNIIYNHIYIFMHICNLYWNTYF